MLKGAVAPVSRGDASCRTPTRHAVRWFRLSLRCSRRFMYREVCFSTARYELHSCHSLHSPCTLPVIPFVYRASGEWREWNGGACGASGTVGARGTDGLAPPHADILFPLQGTLNQNPALLFDVCHEDRWSLPDDIRWHKPRSDGKSNDHAELDVAAGNWSQQPSLICDTNMWTHNVGSCGPTSDTLKTLHHLGADLLAQLEVSVGVQRYITARSRRR